MQHIKRIRPTLLPRQPSRSNALEPVSCRPWFTIGFLLLITFFLFAHEPALANKFETIGGGFGGSRQLKLDWLQGFLYVVGGLSLLGAILAVTFPRQNALFLNATNWKQSAAVLLILSGICIGGGLLL
jgi:hypothetical protein